MGDVVEIYHFTRAYIKPWKIGDVVTYIAKKYLRCGKKGWFYFLGGVGGGKS